MRNPLLLLLVCTRLVNAGCDCGQMEDELERETMEDARYHGCRNCRAVKLSASACPAIGYECSVDYRLTTNVLSATGCCQCKEAKCAGSAKLAHAGIIVNKIRCNNSEWTSKGEPVESVVCAKDCSRTCMRGNSEAPNDFTPVKVTPATGRSEAKCGSIGTCANGLVSINADGTQLTQLDDVLSVACSVDGLWTYSLSSAAERQQFVMCNASPCGPARCPAQTPNPPINFEVPLDVTGKGEACAEATCSTGYVEMAADGTRLRSITTSKLTCTTEGDWKTDGGETYEYVMCNQPPCPYNCDVTPMATPILNGGIFTSPTRKGCGFYCPNAMGLFRKESARPYSIPSATCQSDNKYHSDSFTEARIGCYKCIVADGEYRYADPNSPVKPIVDHCVMSCPGEYRVIVKNKQADLLFWEVQHIAGFGVWYHPQTQTKFDPDTVIGCIPK